MTAAPTSSPRFDAAPRGVRTGFEYVEGWGMAVGAHARVLRPRGVDELRAAFAGARENGTKLALRGSGCSYGDASVNERGAVVDVRGMNRILAWDPRTGIAECEPGVTLEQLWKTILADGWWPRVVSGTMFPTLAGAAAMNIHGKNNFAVGTIGDAVREFDLVTPTGELLTCDRERNADVFHAAIGGFGMLGSFARIVLETKRVHSGELEVRGISVPGLAEAMEEMDARTQDADYLVAWLDAFAEGDRIGRGLIHEARYLAPGADPAPERTLTVAHQELPPNILGVPKSEVWRALRLLNHDAGMRALNALKYQMGRLEEQKGWYRQSHAGFAFLLDYVPNWKWAYGRRAGHGLIQYQAFVPKETAYDVLRDVFASSQRAGIVPYLAVLKRYRPDPFWLTHAVDGWSLALDYKVTPATRDALWRHCHALTDRVLDGGGRFYFAKDLVLRPGDARRMFPAQRLAEFAALKRKLDPDRLLETNLARRVFDGAW
ncbi:MAG: FAD-binding oxidoreductase [Planctomycetes bacterium]|nr:FAD-binding oxidoreductase [Planctomycetota bacterium]